MENKTCGTCKHFRKHYVKLGRANYHEIDEGHCVYPRQKWRETTVPACEHYKQREPEPK